MPRYKTALTDYEGMQATLESHAAQGWRLFSVTPDTWRKTLPAEGDDAPPPFEGLSPMGTPTIEYTASYYLLVFLREDPLDSGELAAAASAERPLGRSRKSPFQSLE